MLNRRTLLAVPPALMLASVAGAAPATPLRWQGGYLFLRIRVNGRPVDALLDSAAEMTLIDRAHAASLGVGSQGDDVGLRGSGAAVQKSTLVKGVTIDAVGQNIGPITVAVSDLSDVANRLLHGQIAVVLGRDLFDAAPFLIDLRAPSIAPLTRRGGRDGRRLPLTTQFGIETFPVTINGLRANATFDLGNGSGMTVSAKFAERAGLRPGRGPRAGGGLGGMVIRATVQVGRLDIAGRAFSNVEAALEANDHASDANIGTDLLRHFRLGVDFPQHAIWMQPV
jgi:predicted aspartyl protease